MSDKTHNLPDIEDLDDVILSTNDEDEVIYSSRKNNRKTIVAAIIVFLIVVSLAVSAAFVFLSNELSNNEMDLPVIQSDQQRAIPEEIASFRPAPPIIPMDSNNVADDVPPPAMMELTPSENDDAHIIKVEQRLELIDDVTQQLEKISAHITQLSTRVSDLENNEQAYKAKNQANETLLSQLKSQINKLSRELTLLANPVINQKAQTEPPSRQAAPPAPLSFAIWNGRDAVMIEHPAGKIKLLYISDIVDNWRVISMTSNSVTYQSLIDNQSQTRTLRSK